MSADNLIEGVELIERGMSKFRSGPLDYYLKCLMKARDLVLNHYAPFKVGDKVTLSSTFKIHHESSWNSCRHFLCPGSVGVVRDSDVTPDGIRFDIEFEDESWIGTEGMVRPVSLKHVFSLRENELTKL